MFSCLLTWCCGTTVLDIYLLLCAIQGIQGTKFGGHILVFSWYVVCLGQSCAWNLFQQRWVEVLLECETDCWRWFKMVHSPFFPNCTVLVSHFGFQMVFFFLQFYRCWCKNTVAMDQRKNDSFVPSITQLEDFLTEHDSNVVWLLVGKINFCFGSISFMIP